MPGRADKAAALASYARQAEDDTLLKMAQRIKARAVRREGELIEPGKNRFDDRRGGASPPNRKAAALEAGISYSFSCGQADWGAVAGVGERAGKTFR